MKKIFIIITTLFITTLTLINYNPEVVASDYYSSININDSLDDFSSDLTSLLTRTHTYKSYGSSYNSVLAEGAATSVGASTLTLFYTGYIDNASNAGGANIYEWNKEHVWPKSLTGGEGSAPANDIHNIRPTNTQVNSRRSNLPFGEDFGGAIATGGVPYGEGSTYSYYGNGYFEPRDEVKGDCARIIFYLLTRYDSLNLNVNTVGDMDMLLRWHYDDPVDTYETNMNDAIYEFQGNRNPYIDHPEYVDKMYPNDYGMTFEELDSITLPTTTNTNLSLPSKAGEYDITWTSNNQNVITNNGVITRDVENVNVVMTASITKDGKVGSKQFTVTVEHREYTLEEHLEYAKMKNALEVEFTQDGTEEQIITARTGTINNSDTFLNFSSGTNYANIFGLDDEIFTLEEVSKTQNYGAYFYKNETLSMYQGTVIKLSSNAGSIKSVKVTYSTSSYGGTYLSATTSGGNELFDNVAHDTNSEEVYLIQTTTQCRITSIEVTYSDTHTSYSVNNVLFNFGFEIDKTAFDELSMSSNFEIGILYKESNEINISNLYNNESLDTFMNNNGLLKSTVSKSDSNSNYLFTANLIQSDLTQNINACGYIIYNNQIYFTQTLSRSVEDVINIYIENYQDDYVVSQYIDLLKYLLKK